MKILVKESRVENLVKRYFKSKVGDYFEFETPDLNTNYKYLKYINQQDMVLGEFRTNDGSHLGYLVLDNEMMLFKTKTIYFAIKEEIFLDLQKLFHIPKYQLAEIMTSVISEILNKKINYTIEV